jgi:pyruvate/2-oxoglutarate dehydrogenase complex dihydrolipoamide dehydrogenase (E3) component
MICFSLVGCPTEPDYIDVTSGATCITHPQVASLGLREEQVVEGGRPIKVERFERGGAGGSVAYDKRAGLAKIISEASDSEISSAKIVGDVASTGIRETFNLEDVPGDQMERCGAVVSRPTMSGAIFRLRQCSELLGASRYGWR